MPDGFEYQGISIKINSAVRFTIMINEIVITAGWAQVHIRPYLQIMGIVLDFIAGSRIPAKHQYRFLRQIPWICEYPLPLAWYIYQVESTLKRQGLRFFTESHLQISI